MEAVVQHAHGFALGRPGPAEVGAPDASRLGPDPEPVGCRFEALVGPLGDVEREIYDAAAAGTAQQIAEIVRPGDIVLLHDPQTAGIVPMLRGTGAHVIWRAHIGLDLPNDLARRAWSFLLPYVEPAE